jgi:ABC-type transport system involved in cytochrome c biogenesis permease component
MKLNKALDTNARFVHVVWALAYVAVLVWTYGSQPFGDWSAWFAFLLLVTSLVWAFWDTTKTDQASSWGLLSILVGVLAAAFDGDSAVITLASQHHAVKLLDLVLLIVTLPVLICRSRRWDRRRKQHREKQSPDDMLRHITTNLWYL